MANTIKERKAALTKEIVKARAHFQATKRLVELGVKRTHPELQWWEVMAEVEKDRRYKVAETRLLALCDAANIMGVEIE